MGNHRLPFSSLLVFAVAITLACGSPSSLDPPRSVQSITISPATANAQDYPDAQVPFTATGYYATPPSPVTPLTATWGACSLGGSSTSEVSVTANGVAQCATGSVGTYTVWAFVVNQPSQGACPTWVNACGGGGCRVTGTAQLTCP
jgi:hypothetical protein